MISVSADFNNISNSGQTVRASLRRISAPLVIGDVVTAVDANEGMACEATVARINGQRVYLTMHWDSE